MNGRAIAGCRWCCRCCCTGCCWQHCCMDRLLFRPAPRPAPTLAIEARVVDARSVRGAVQPPQPNQRRHRRPPPEPVGPPQPTPEELAQREQEHQQEEAAAAEQQRAAEQQAAEDGARRPPGARRSSAQRRTSARRVRRRRQRSVPPRSSSARPRRRSRASAKEDLQRDLAAEEQARKARAGPALASWESQIAAKINRAWLRPPTARPGIECMLNVTQVPGGEVTEVSIGACNGDQAVRESIEAAVYRASPLPPPPDPALFDRHLRIDFKPD